MNLTIFNLSELFYLYARLNFHLFKRNTYFILVALLLNSATYYLLKNNFNDIEPNFTPVNLNDLYPGKKFEFYYAPTSKAATQMCDVLKLHHTNILIRGYPNITSLMTVKNRWEENPADDFTYLQYKIKNISDLNVTYKSEVFNIYKYKMDIDGNGYCPYVATIFEMVRAFLYNLTKEPMNAHITGLPHTLYYESTWPSIQMIFFFFYFGLTLLHLRKVRSVCKDSLFPVKGMTAMITYTMVLVQYYCLLIIAFGLTCLVIDKLKIITKLNWYELLFLFTSNMTTLLFSAIFISEFDMKVYNLLYYIGILLTPQFLYLFAFGQVDFIDCYYAYFTCFNTMSTVGWSLALIESVEAKSRFNISHEDMFNKDFKKCFGLITLVYVQIGLSCLLIIFVIYVNFFKSRVDLLLAKHSEARRLSRKKTSSKTSIKISGNLKRRRPGPGSSGITQDRRPFQQGTQRGLRVMSVFSSDYAMSLYNVSYAYQTIGFDKKALKHVTMKFRKNHVTTILGPNGSGKTTLIKILTGQLKPRTGLFVFDGRSIQNYKDNIAPYITQCVSNMKLFYSLTVREYFEIVIKQNNRIMFNELSELVEKSIEICDIGLYRDKKIELCPFSIRRIIQIISSFMTPKPILVLDDPMYGLDPIYTQNVSALFAFHKHRKTIIYTSCDSNSIEYVTDAAYILINGRKVAESNLEKISVSHVYYKLICCIEHSKTDYALVRYLEEHFSFIKYDYSFNNIAFFNLPKLNVNEIFNILKTIESHSNKLNVAGYKIVPMRMRHYLSYLYDCFLKRHNFESSGYYLPDVLPQKTKSHLNNFFRIFQLRFTLEMAMFYKYPHQLILRYVIPLVVMLVWLCLVIVLHVTKIDLTTTAIHVNYVTEQKSTFCQIYSGCRGNNDECRKFIQSIKNRVHYCKRNIKSIYNQNTTNAFNKFLDELNKEGLSNNIFYNNHTLYGIFVDFTTKPTNLTILANTYPNRLESLIVSTNELISPGYVIPVEIKPFLAKYKPIFDANYLFRLILFILCVFNITTNKNIRLKNEREAILLHRLSGIHYTLIIFPKFIMDFGLFFLMICFQLLIIYVIYDQKMTNFIIDPSQLMSAFFLYAMSDMAYKLFLSIITHYSPITSFTALCLDQGSLIITNTLYYQYFIQNILNNSYHFIRFPTDTYSDRVFRIILPIAALNYGLKSSSTFRSFNGVHGILIFQFIVYITMIFVYQSVKFRLKIWFINHQCCGTKARIATAKILPNFGTKTPLLYFKNVSLYLNNHLYFRDISMSFYPKQIWAIIGRNGVGKSYLIEIMLNKIKPTTGGVYFNGTLLNTEKLHMNDPKITYLSPILFGMFELTVEESLIYWARLKNLPEKKISHVVKCLINLMLLTNETKEQVLTLSEMSIKKLNIAICVMGYPQLIILDDPYCNLDAVSKQGVSHLLTKARAKNSCIVITTTSLVDVRNLITHIAFLNHTGIEYKAKYRNIVLTDKMGYYLTIYINKNEVLLLLPHNILTILLKTFPGSVIHKISPDNIIYFIPYKKNAPPNTTKILVFMESIKERYNIIYYLIRHELCFTDMSNPMEKSQPPLFSTIETRTGSQISHKS